MAQTTLEHGGNVYRIGELTPMQQFHVFRRLAPLIGSVQAEISEAVSAPSTLPADASESDQKNEFSARVMGVIAKVLGTMADAEVEYIVNTCLGVVSRQQNDRFAPVMNSGRLMFSDVDMPTMLRLTTTTVQENLGGFFAQGIGALI